MKLERALQICVALLVVLGTVMLFLDRAGIGYSSFVVFVAITSVLFTDMLGWFRLHRHVANMVGAVAALYCFSVFIQTSGQEQMGAIARFLIYLQIVLLYQEKKPRSYWYLAILSMLQVVIAAAMNQGIVFGFLLLIYMAVAIAVLALLFIHREISRIGENDNNPSLAENTNGAESNAGELDILRGGPPIAYRDFPERNILGPQLGRMMFRHIAILALVTMTFTAVLFSATPRTRNSPWSLSPYSDVAVVGFPVNVDLSEYRKIQESDELVMRVAFFQKDEDGDDVPFVAGGEPYYQGAVLSWYSWRETAWGKVRSGVKIPLEESPPNENIIRQKILLQPSESHVLFGVFPVCATEGSQEKIKQFSGSLQLVRPEDNLQNLQQPYRYVLGTTSFRNGRQARVTSDRRGGTGGRPEFDRFGFSDRVRFSNLTRIARQHLIDQKIDRNDHAAVARSLESHFFAAGIYKYTLDLRSISRDEDLDPIEDFVTNHHSGHCEFFASALAMMLRSQGIPSRIIVGYRGGEYNSVGKYYLLRQRHAHAWVEAYLEPEQAKKELGPQHPDGLGAWLRLDPTPSSDVSQADAENKSLWDKAEDVFQYAQVLWSEYVLGLNAQKQSDVLYDPLASGDTETLQNTFSLPAWLKYFQRTAAAWGFDFSNWEWKNWFSWRGGVAAMAISLIGVGLYRLARRLGPRLFRWSSRLRAPVGQRRKLRVEFYERLAELLRQCGIDRDVGQTQREFAAAAVGHLSDSAFSREIANLPRPIVEAFYRVRFGSDALDKDEQDKIEQSLSQFEAAIVKDR